MQYNKCQVRQQRFGHYVGIMKKMVVFHIRWVTVYWKQVHMNKWKFTEGQFICTFKSDIKLSKMYQNDVIYCHRHYSLQHAAQSFPQDCNIVYPYACSNIICI